MEEKSIRSRLKRKVTVTAVTAAILAASVILPACSKNERTSPSPSATASGSSTSPYAKPLEITWIGHGAFGKTYSDSNPAQKLIEEKFNVKIKIVNMDLSNAEQIRLYFADGKTADHIRMNTAADAQLLMDQGLLKEISEEKLRKFMPTWMKSLESMVDPKIVKSSMYYKGKIYGVPFFNFAGIQPNLMGIRKDWLDNVGITKYPETIEEYHEVLKRFTFNDPDKNGKNDTYGGHGVQLYLKGAFGLGAPEINYYVDKAGKIYSTATSDNYKQYLKVLQSWYKEGLIDPESITDQRPQQRAKWSNGKFGVLADHPWWFAGSTPDNLTKILLDKNPNAKLDFFKPFAGPDGQKGATTGLNYPAMNFGFGFGKDTSDEKIERIMAIKEYIAANDDFWTRLYYGEEGKGYTKNKDGIIQVTPEYLNNDKLVAEGLNNFYALRPETWEFKKKTGVFKDELPAYEIAMNSPVVYNTVNFTYSGKNEAQSKYGTALNTIVTEFMTNAITGKLDIDKEWEAFKKRYLDAGGTATINEWQKLYDESNK